MTSVPHTTLTHKPQSWTLTLTPIRWAIAVLLCVLAGALLAAGTILPRWQGYLGQCATEDLNAAEDALQAQAAHAHAEAAIAAKEAARRELLRATHPELFGVEFRRAITPEGGPMPFGGAKGQQGLDGAYTGTLTVNLTHTVGQDPPPLDYCGVTAFLATCAVEHDSVHTASGQFRPVTADDAQWDAIQAWFSEYDVPAGNLEYNAQLWRVYISTPNDPFGVLNAYYLVSGWADLGLGDYNYYGPGGDVELAWSIGLDGAYRRAKTTASIPSGYTYVRDTRQLTGQGHWHGDADTDIAATCGELNAQDDYGLGGETDFTEGGLIGLTVSLRCNISNESDVVYSAVSCAQCDFSNWTFYWVSGAGDFAWMGDTTETGYDPTPDPGDVLWQAIGSGSSIGLQAGDGYAAGGAEFASGLNTRAWKIIPRLWQQNKVDSEETETSGDGWARYTEYDDSAGHPFELNLYRHSGETAADVSVAPDWDGLEYTETWTFAYDGVPADKWRKFTNSGNGITVSLRKDWLEANNEDVPFTDPTTMEEATGDIRQQLTMHPLDIELDEVPWHDDWITWERVELNLDKPEGTRPSLWTGVGAVDVTGEVWTIPAAGGTVSRTLAANVRRNRLKRMNDHLWTGSGDQQQVSDDWPLMTRHDLDIGVTGDDPKWRDSGETPWPGDEVGIDYEDISDWRGFSCVEAEFSNVSEDQTVQLRLTYRYLSGANPYYVGASYKYGTELGEFESSWSSTQTVTIDGTLYAGTGKVKWDLAPDAGEAAWIEDAELVETVEFIFPETSGEQALTFVGFDTVAYAGDGTDEQMVRTAHLYLTDWFGGRVWVDGMPDYQPTYLYTMDSERVEVGYKNVQQAKHNPDSELTDDITSLKSLARWYNEQTYAETLMDPTWGTAAYNAALVDEDTTTLSVPYCTDYDEDGFCLHVGVHDDCNSPGPVHIYCDCILQGGVRGVAKKDGVRAPGYDGKVRLYRSTDGGTTVDQIASADTDSQGAYRIGSGREKAPRTYYVKGVWEPTVSLGGFVNAEEHWAAVAVGEVPEGRKVDMFRHPFGNVPWTAWLSGGDLKVAETFDGKLTLGTVRTLDTSAAYSSVSADTDGNTIYVDAVKTADETLWRWYSDDHGETWTGPTQLA